MRYRNRRQPNKVLALVIVVAVFIAAMIIIVSVASNAVKDADTLMGVSYIKLMENKDTSVIENNIFNASRQKIIDELMNQIDDDPDALWRTLTEMNTVMMGDSRVVGYDVYGLLDESHVLAGGGYTILNIKDDLGTLQVLNPNLLVLAYGINDINNYWIWDSKEEWLKDLDEIVGDLYERFPNTYIYVQSIIPASVVALEESPSWAVIPEWNADIKQLCDQRGYRYLDITDVVNEHTDLYDIDGVHLQRAFYYYWGEAILERYLRDSGA